MTPVKTVSVTPKAPAPRCAPTAAPNRGGYDVNV